MEWFKKHADAMVTISFIVGAVIWNNAQFNQLRADMDARFSVIEKEIAIMKTVLIMQRLMPAEMAKIVEGEAYAIVD